ncbi:MAG: hypothetical protein QOI89_45 [Solirubrobacteraceae bacterium]|jgi:hypothetical protein|nr:hypothetical protein [Solirubrobacteraceae bacterium]
MTDATLHLATAEAFADVDEPGADALVGTKDAALIPVGGDVMAYGDGGAGKTTLALDLGCHLAAGDPWLGMPIARPARVLVIENEGPRPLFRAKLRRKLAGWSGSPLEGRLKVLESPWATVTLADEEWAAKLADVIREGEVDALIAGPVTRLGMDDAGTLQEVRDFMRLVEALRSKSGRRLAVVLVHHENKGGTVSGAWEGAGDTLLHVEARGPGHTHLLIQKARWSSEHHGTGLDLAWTEGEGFTVEDARDVAAEIAALLADGAWRTTREIANKRDHAKTPGIGASRETVEAHVKARPDVFLERSGAAAKEVGRSANATVYGLASAQKPHSADSGFPGAADGSGLLASPIGEPVGARPVQTPQPELDQGQEPHAPEATTEPDSLGADPEEDDGWWADVEASEPEPDTEESGNGTPVAYDPRGEFA